MNVLNGTGPAAGHPLAAVDGERQAFGHQSPMRGGSSFPRSGWERVE
jgi:hypothetical protein